MHASLEGSLTGISGAYNSQASVPAGMAALDSHCTRRMCGQNLPIAYNAAG